jgi:uncharacterized membrane protein YeaQ/YmgE (transglycosylase-associated protein family)
MSSADTQRWHLSNFAQYPTSLRFNITRAVVAFAIPLSDRKDPKMDLLGESLLVILVVGIIAGWLAGELVGRTGLGLIGDLIVGIAGAFIASWIFPSWNLSRFGHRLGDRRRHDRRGIASSDC